MSSSKFFRKMKSLLVVSGIGTTFIGGYSYYKNDEKFFDTFFMPTMRLFDAERAHELAVMACKWKILPRNSYDDPNPLV